MDELVRMVAQKVGVPEDKARQAVEVVLTQLKQNLPDPIASQFDGLIAGNKSLKDLNNLEGLLKGGNLGGLLGGKK